MQLTTINKFVNLVLTGAVALVMVLLLDAKSEPGLFEKIFDSPVFKSPLAAGVNFIAASTMLGLLVEAIADLTVRRLLSTAAESSKWSRRLLAESSYEKAKDWQFHFERAIKDIHCGGGNLERLADTRSRGLATTISYAQNGDFATVRAVAHYATFVLATDVIVLVVIGGIIANFQIFSGWYFVLGNFVALIVCGILSRLAVDYYQYSYELMYRRAYFWAITYESKGSIGGEGDGQIGRSSLDDYGR